MTLLFRCKEVTARLTDFQEGVLPLDDSARVRLHLLACPSCRTLLREVRHVPGLFQKGSEGLSERELPLAKAALGAVLTRLGQPRAPRPRRAAPVPEALRSRLQAGADLPLRLLAEAHAALAEGERPSGAPYIPASVMRQLPLPETWNWRKLGSARIAELLVDPAEGQRLIVMHAPPHFQALPHRHRGSESILVLNGDMEDGDSLYQDGQWVHFGEGSVHAPTVYSDGCWALIREEGDAQYQGLLGKLAGILLGH